MKKFKTFLFLLCCCTSLIAAPAQKDSSFVFEKSTWKKNIHGVDYTETFKEFDEKTPKETSFNTPSLDYDWSFLKYFFYALVVGLVLFLLYKILSNLNQNPNIKKQEISIESIEEIEEKMYDIDLEQLLSEALNNQNYHIALRINFLIIIKLLSEKKKIVWAKEKTNWEYYTEIKDVITKDGFKLIIMSFEPVWYGEHLLTKSGFELMQPLFKKFQKQLTTNE